MKRYNRAAIATVVASSLAIGLGVSPAAAEEPDAAAITISDEATGSTTEVDGGGLDANVEVDYSVDTDESIDLTSIAVDATIDGAELSETLVVEELVILSDSHYSAKLRVLSSGEVLNIDSTAVEQQAFPVLYVLGILARLGIKHVIKVVGKAQVKKAVKSYLLNNISASKWTHIMAPKHKWGTVGAKSREQIADLMGKAMADGTHSAYGSGAMQAVLKHQGKTIVVTYSKATGKVSNGWVK